MPAFDPIIPILELYKQNIYNKENRNHLKIWLAKLKIVHSYTNNGIVTAWNVTVFKCLQIIFLYFPIFYDEHGRW